MGTDTGPAGRWQGFFEHLELEMMVEAGMTPMQVLVASTGEAARCHGRAGQFGSIEVGASADLLVLDGESSGGYSQHAQDPRACGSRVGRCSNLRRLLRLSNATDIRGAGWAHGCGICFAMKTSRSSARFLRRGPTLQPTPLHLFPAQAKRLGLAQLSIKDETRPLRPERLQGGRAQRLRLATLKARGLIRPGATLACASEGNHGRAVARSARLEGCSAVVYVADSVARARVAAIEREGATVQRVAGTYDDAVRRMLSDAARERWTIISDTSWAGYDGDPATDHAGVHPTARRSRVASIFTDGRDLRAGRCRWTAGGRSMLGQLAIWESTTIDRRCRTTFCGVCSGLCQGKRSNRRRRPV